MAAPTTLSATRAAGGTLVVLGAAAVWSIVAAVSSGGDPLPMVAVIGTSAAAFGFGAATGRIRPWIVPVIVVGTGAIVAAATGSDVASARPAHGPFGYSNATGAFYVQVFGAGLMLAVMGPGPRRWLGVAAAAGAAIIVLAASSTAATAMLVVVAAAAVSSRAGRGGAAVRTVTALFGLAFLGTIAVGVASGRFAGGVPGGGVFDQTRKTLWHEAVSTIGEHPLTGVGPGGFSESSSLARDADVRRAHHGFLQVGAETGVVGMGLVVLVFAWLLASFAGRPDPSGPVVLGAACLAALGIGACVDYLMHFPAIPVTAAALAGTATSQIDA